MSVIWPKESSYLISGTIKGIVGMGAMNVEPVMMSSKSSDRCRQPHDLTLDERAGYYARAGSDSSPATPARYDPDRERELYFMA